MYDRIADMANALVRARTDLIQIPSLNETDGLTAVEDAYAVQNASSATWRAQGRRSIGWKIGLTSKAVQAQLGIDLPDFGTLWADYAFSEGEVVHTRCFKQPKFELEVAFVLNRRIDDPLLPMYEIMRRVEYPVAAVEIVDSAIRDWKIKVADTVTDNASGGGILIGLGARQLTDLDQRLVGGILSRNGGVSRGLSADYMRHPLNAVLWLARTMAALGLPLQDGDLVMSGALGPTLPVVAGEVYLAGFAPIQVAFDDGRVGS